MLNIQCVTHPNASTTPGVSCHKRVLVMQAVLRFAARFMDLIIGSVAIGFIFSTFFPGLMQLPTGISTMFMLLTWVFIEAQLLSIWGSTPGKWAFNISITSSAGEKLSLLDALKRSFLVYMVGLGAGLPIITYLASIASYYKVITNKKTYWDESTNTLVIFKPIDRIRCIGIIVFCLVATGFIYMF